MVRQKILSSHSIIFALFREGITPPENVCASALGLESGQIPGSAMTASSVHSQYFEAERARLNKKNEGSYYGAWVPRRSTLGEWIQIDLGKNVKVTRIATQGRHNGNWWTRSYSLSFRIQGGSTFEPYNNSQVCFVLPELEMVEISY